MEFDEALVDDDTPELDLQVSTFFQIHMLCEGVLDTYMMDCVTVTVSLAESSEIYQIRSRQSALFPGDVPFRFVMTRTCKPGASVGEVKNVTSKSKISGDAAWLFRIS